MKWLIWSPAIVLILSAAAVPGGVALFAVPLLALGYLLFSVIALGGSDEHGAATRARPVREQREPASDLGASVAIPSARPVGAAGSPAKPAILMAGIASDALATETSFDEKAGLSPVGPDSFRAPPGLAGTTTTRRTA
jgi:hypothetical protein